MKNILYLSLILLFSCKQDKPHNSYLGILNIDVNGNKKAIPHFEKGLLLLHSFEYTDARDAFLKAQIADPSMSMAYWGEAMTYNHPLWSEQDYDMGMEALTKIKNSKESAQINELESDFIKGIHILYESDSSKTERDKNYSRFMAGLNKKYPDNHEVAAFYALSLLGSVSDGRDENIYGKGAVIAQGILKENPKHPGALHYLIHSYDDPDHAKLALSAADAYAVVAPDASHALHMPSHIYVALGMWDKVVSSNENSYQASINRMIEKNLAPKGRGFHAYHWLAYGYLQQGRINDAKKMVVDMQGYTNEDPGKYARSHMVYLKGTYLVESDDWAGELANIPVEITDLNVSTRSQYNFIEGMKGFKQNDMALLQNSINKIKKDFDKESYLVSFDDAPFCSGANRYNTSPSMLLETEIMLYQLKAMESWLKEENTTAESHFLKTFELEENLSYSYGPPVIQKPTHELYAEFLLTQKRTDEALQQYNSTLIRAPKRRKALIGIAKCQQINGETVL